MSNIIPWIFDKMFDQLTCGTQSLFTVPFKLIREKTFDNTIIYDAIHKLTKKTIMVIKEYLTSETFMRRYLFTKIRKKLLVEILLGADISKLLVLGYKIDYECVKLAVLNNRFDIVKGTEIALDDELLCMCAEFGYEEMYGYLRDRGLQPNVSVYKMAVRGNSDLIVRDISEVIALSGKIIEAGFESGNVINFLMDQAQIDNVIINNNLVSYLILRGDFERLAKFDVKWHVELYYSAILSGSLDMMMLVESKIDVHYNRILDCGRRKKGHRSLLLDDMVYDYGGKKYFSHVIEYAVQSNSLPVLKYLCKKNYIITASNFITAIKQGSIEILKYLCKYYEKRLPFYYLHYFSTWSYIPDKFAKAKILLDANMLSLSTEIMTATDYQKETVHIEMIRSQDELPKNSELDLDYLMSYKTYFNEIPGYKMKNRLLVIVRICLELGLDECLREIFLCEVDQHVVDTLFLFGSVEQIKNYYGVMREICAPSKIIVMEIVCYNQIGKLCYLANNGMLGNDVLQYVFPLSVALNDPLLTMFMNKICDIEAKIEWLIVSGDQKIIGDWLDKNEVTDIELLKKIIMLDNINIISKTRVPPELKSELVEWCIESDLLEMSKYL